MGADLEESETPKGSASGCSDEFGDRAVLGREVIILEQRGRQRVCTPLRARENVMSAIGP
jgi:hypothetical protein